MCHRSSDPGQSRKTKGTRKRRVRTQDMIEEVLRYLDESDPDSIEDGCLLLGLTLRLDRSCLKLSFQLGLQKNDFSLLFQKTVG